MVREYHITDRPSKAYTIERELVMNLLRYTSNLNPSKALSQLVRGNFDLVGGVSLRVYNDYYS